MTASCDPDHLGKRFRARVKTAMGIRIGDYTFTKTDLTLLLQKASLVQSPEEAHRLFHPDDLMDVQEMVLCLNAVSPIQDYSI